MKAILALFVLTGAGFALTGCESDLPPDSEAQNKIERGLSGRGSLSTPNKAEDPMIRNNPNGGY